MIDLEKMAKEHEALFPLADLQSQENKLSEELFEVLQELVDVLIVGAGINRFNPKEAYELKWKIEKVCEILYIPLPTFEDAVNRKWQINLKRKWEWNGKTYHHVEE